MKKRLLAATGLLVLCAWSVVRTALPPRPVPASAPDTVFSAERAMRHVKQIAVRPHAIGTPDHDRVRDYIVGELAAIGLHPQIQETTAISTRYREAGRVQNILAWLPGRLPTGKAVLVMAHYDGVEAGPSAGDDGAGAAAVLETARAIRARKTPLAHDVIVLLTDGEEPGLLGAAAFVREHPWAKDVAVVINFEARGTTGRSFMFETGPGDLAAVRALRRVGGASAGSVYTSIYRTIPNDTDLSELAVLQLPALNFAFADGVERYHTAHDDVAHLNAGSVQHHGSQMLGLVRELGNGPLPLPRTSDAVFFDLPSLGLIVYPMTVALPLAIIALVIAALAAFREGRGIIIGIVTSLIAVGAAAVLARFAGDALGFVQARLPWSGAVEWSGIHGAAIAMLAVAATLFCYGIARWWATDRGVEAGALIVWAILSLIVAVKVPGASYLFTWPTLFAAFAMLTSDRVRPVALWIMATITLLLIAGFTYGVSIVMLGVSGSGAIALGVLVSLVTLLMMPLLNTVVANLRLSGAPWALAAAGVFALIGVFVTRRSAEHPARTALAYTQNADSDDAWLGSVARFRDNWTLSALGAMTPTPDWAGRGVGGGRFVGRKVTRVPLAGPSVTLVRDTLVNGARRIVLRVLAPSGASAVLMRASGAPVSSASLDGRVVDTTRYRYPSRDWTMGYSAVPDTGAIVALSIPSGAKIDFEVTSRTPGLPAIPGVVIPARPSGVVPVQTGDASYVYRRVTF
jgi:hypothetical protein